jgi:hypothetical protein
MNHSKHKHDLLIKYHNDLKNIDLKFRDKANEIPLDLPPYAHLSRLDLLNSNANDKRKITSEMLIHDLKMLELTEKVTWLSLGIIIGSLIGVVVIFII